MILLSGSSHPDLSRAIASHLDVTVGQVEIGRFPDGEISFRLLESVRGQDVFVVQTIAGDPNHYLVELLIMIDAIRRASARSVTAVVPYYGYCRQDRKDKPREPITAKLVANMIASAGATHLLTMDLHAGQIEGFFEIPVDHIHAISLLADSFKKEVGKNNFVVVAPDIGSVKLAHKYAKALGAELAIIDKQRLDSTHVGVAAVIGDVKGKDVLLADDMCSTGGTLVSAAKACQEKGAHRIFVAVTHGLFMENALKKIEDSPIERLFVSDTIPLSSEKAQYKKLKTISAAPLFADAIRCIESGQKLNVD